MCSEFDGMWWNVSIWKKYDGMWQCGRSVMECSNLTIRQCGRNVVERGNVEEI